MNESVKAQKALDYFMSGYNCAQSVFTAFHEEMGLDETTALRLSSGMGGGLGGLRAVCGTVSAMGMILGKVSGYEAADDLDGKRRLYARIQEMAKQFTNQYDTIVCLDLLKANGVRPSPIPSERNAEYYKKRPCARYVEAAASIIEQELQKGETA